MNFALETFVAMNQVCGEQSLMLEWHNLEATSMVLTLGTWTGLGLDFDNGMLSNAQLYYYSLVILHLLSYLELCRTAK